LPEDVKIVEIGRLMYDYLVIMLCDDQEPGYAVAHILCESKCDISQIV